MVRVKLIDAAEASQLLLKEAEDMALASRMVDCLLQGGFGLSQIRWLTHTGERFSAILSTGVGIPKKAEGEDDLASR